VSQQGIERECSVNEGFSQRLELFHERSLVWEDEEKIVYLFDYAKGREHSSAQ